VSLPVDPIPYADFIIRHLMQHPVADVPLRAVSETELPIEGDLWFWADDNAKVLEFFAVPTLWSRYEQQAHDLLEFIEKLCYGPFILRRTGRARIEEVRNDGKGRAQFIHTFMDVACDLQLGVVDLGIRFHDGRTARNLTFSGHGVAFSHCGQQHLVNAAGNIFDYSIQFSGDALVLSHTSWVEIEGGGEKRRIGALKNIFSIDSRSMFVDVKFEFQLESNVVISDVVITLSHADMSHGENHVDYGEIRTVSPEGSSMIVANGPGTTTISDNNVSYWSVIQRNWIRGFALAVHSLPHDPSKFLCIEARVAEKEKWDSIVCKHAFFGEYNGDVLRGGEHKVLTSGGFYDQPLEYERMLSHFRSQTSLNPIDFSISYDYGAELNAFARIFRAAAKSSASDESKLLQQKAKSLFDRYFDVYSRLLMDLQESDPSALFARPLAFVIFGLIDMWHTTKDEKYRIGVRRAIDFLLTFERESFGEDGRPVSFFVIGQSQAGIFVDCHSSALLALVRALPVLEDPAIITKIDQGLDAFRIETLGIPLGDIRKEDLVCLGRVPPDRQHDSHAYWNFTAGLTLRLFKILRQSSHQATKEIFERHKNRIELHEALLKLQIEQSLRYRGGALEIKTGRLSGEGNSETQPWVALGLVTDSGDLPPDHQFKNLEDIPVSREDVIAAYRLILGREPESEAALQGHMSLHALKDLRQTFLSSEEFRLALPRPPSHNGLPITAAALEIEIDTDASTLAQMVEKTGEYWHSIGRNAPHWSVVTAKEFLPENITDNQDAFFQSSMIDQDIILSGLARNSLHPSDFKSCVEFGCGVGRLTFRLAALFERVTGIDISAPHLALAREYCGKLGLSNVQFVQADAKALIPAIGFDFWFSRIVLQHNPPPVSMEILRKVFRELPKGGVAMFQVPVHHIGYQFRAKDYLASTLGKNMEMHCVPQRAILNEAHALGMQLLEVREDTWVVSDGPEWLSNNFIFRKN
jgi:SAM-dependent methyltransferase